MNGNFLKSLRVAPQFFAGPYANVLGVETEALQLIQEVVVRIQPKSF